MSPTIGANSYGQLQAFPGAAQKGSVDPKHLETQANAQVGNRSRQETTAVATRPKPVEGKEDNAQARMQQMKEEGEAQRNLIEGGQAMKLEKGARINTYA